MKRATAFIVVLCILLSCIPVASAAEPLTASSPEELVAAIQQAQDGDTITITANMGMGDYTSFGDADKTVILKPDNSFETGNLFTILNSAEQPVTIQNIIIDGGGSSIIAFYLGGTGKIELKNVTIKDFANNANQIKIDIGANVDISNCVIQDCVNGSAIRIFNSATVKITDSVISSCLCTSSGGAIRNNGNLTLQDCVLSDNQAGYNTTDLYTGGAVENGGECIITGGSLTGNIAKVGGGINNTGVLSLTDVFVFGNTSGLPQGSDIFNTGSSLTIAYTGELTDIYTDDKLTPLGWYTDFNGQDTVYYGIDFTITETMALIFKQEAPQPPAPPEDPPIDPIKPTQPEDPIPVDPGPPVIEPEEPEPFIPPFVFPVYPITQPQPEPSSEPEPEPLTLSCGGAVLDTTQTAVLYGYGDGKPHEEDFLTRAQGVTLLYRLLTPESLEQLYTDTNPFRDVNSDMWFNKEVSTITRAGVVQGVGGGLFDPDGVLVWSHLVTLISRFVEPQSVELVNIDVSGHWSAGYIQTAVYYGWLKDSSDFNPDKPVTRGETVDFVNHVFSVCNPQ